MKKTFLFIMAVALCTFLMAQQTVLTKSSVRQLSTYEKYVKNSSDRVDVSNEVTPMLRTSPLTRGSVQYNVIGETYYNTATNSASRNTVSFRNNSDDAAAVWIMGKTSPTRGTGINYFYSESGEWGVIPDAETGRIETQRTGWGGHAFTEEGEIVVGHDTPGKGLVVNTRDKWGQGGWNEYIFEGPTYKNGAAPGDITTLLWPSVVAVGNTVHLFTVTEGGGSIMYNESDFPNEDKWGYKGYHAYPMYYRSLDGGKTFGDPVDFGPKNAGGLGLMTSYELFKFGGDDYVITAKGDHVAILFSTIYGLVYYLESKDAGITWERHTVYHLGEVFLDTYLDSVGPVLLPRSGAIAIDDAGIVHVAFTTALDNRTVDGVGNYYAFPTGMVYWNSTMDQLNWEDFTVTFDPNPSGDNHIIRFENYPGYIPLPSVVGLPGYYCWNGGPTYESDQFGNNGWAAFVRVITKDGKVYLSYQAPLDYPLNFESGGVPVFCRGIFMTVSDNNGATWDVMKNTSWLSYDPDLVYVDWSLYTEDVWPIVDGDEVYYYGGYVEAGMEVLTENAYPSMSHNFNQSKSHVMLEWLNHFVTPFPSGGGGFESDPLSVYTYDQNLTEIPKLKNISEIYKNMWSDVPVIDMVADAPELEDCTNCVKVRFQLPYYRPNSLKSIRIYRDSVKIAEITNEAGMPSCIIDTNLVEGVTYYYQASAVYDRASDPESALSAKYYYKLGDNTDECKCLPHGIKDIKAPTLKLYPNPANGNVWVDVNSDSPYTVTVTNIMGQVVTSMNGNTGKVNLNVSNYTPGIYIVNVRTANAMTSQKLIVK